MCKLQVQGWSSQGLNLGAGVPELRAPQDQHCPHQVLDLDSDAPEMFKYQPQLWPSQYLNQVATSILVFPEPEYGPRRA